MIKPRMLQPGDKVAIVSLSSGIIGEPKFIHKYELGKKRLEEEFGLKVVAMPNALKGIEFVYNNPKLRAKDLMDAFKDESIKAIICAIGGDDSIRLLPFIDYEVIKNNPKIFMGYSDSTISHFIMYKAGLVSFYGPALMTDFAEYVFMFDYTKDAIKNMLFKINDTYEIKSSEYWSKDFIPWGEENINKQRKLIKEEHGYEVLQGFGKVKGKLLGGCIDVFPMCVGTSIWPSINEWKDKILFIETSEEKITPEYLKHYLRNLMAQGIFNVINGIIVGKPQEEAYYEEYKEIYKKVVGVEAQKPDLPIVYNVNIGHAVPIGIFPIGIETEINCDNKTITFLESPVVK